MVPEIWCARDRQTDRQKKWHIEVGAPAKTKLNIFTLHFYLSSINFLTPSMV